MITIEYINKLVDKVKNNTFDVEELKKEYKDFYKNADFYLLDKNIKNFDPPLLQGDTLSLLSLMSLHKFILIKSTNNKLPKELKDLYDLDGIYTTEQNNLFFLNNKSIKEEGVLTSKSKNEFNICNLDIKTLLFLHKESNKEYSASSINTHNFRLKLRNNNQLDTVCFSDLDEIQVVNMYYEHIHGNYYINNNIKKLNNEFSEDNFVNESLNKYCSTLFHETSHLFNFYEYQSEAPFDKIFKGRDNINIEEAFSDTCSSLMMFKEISNKPISMQEKEELIQLNYKNLFNLRDYSDKILEIDEDKFEKNMKMLEKCCHLTQSEHLILYNALDDIGVKDLKDLSISDIKSLSRNISLTYENKDFYNELINEALKEDELLKDDPIIKKSLKLIEHNNNFKNLNRLIISRTINLFNQSKIKENVIIIDYKEKISAVKKFMNSVLKKQIKNGKHSIKQ